MISNYRLKSAGTPKASGRVGAGVLGDARRVKGTSQLALRGGRISGKLEGSSSSSNQNGYGCYMEFARTCLWMASRILHEAVDSLEMRALDLQVKASGPKIRQVCGGYSKGIRGVFRWYSGVFGYFSGYSGILPCAETWQASYFWTVPIGPSAPFIILNKGITISGWAATRATIF